MRRAQASAATLAVLAFVASSCAGPTVTSGQYRAKVAQTAKAMTGIIVTAQHAARLDLDGRMLHTVTDAVVSDAEQDADSVRTTISSRQPPDTASDRLREQVDQPVEQAVRLLTDLRIAVRRDDDRAQRTAADALAGPLAAFDRLSEVGS
ncbi:hypothetical protein FHX82_005153 [Amycolatopsis bartoniae]|uniref:Uncharacterized protein n=1 Tax=Amycolatopsis bartoniae TaxID=941986 RepID=A0A8H9ISJ5_9PSEU|nr:hypothetical protein [Amycolatopsis bartoniae]MBB2938077.1 hypothetical protein [Amycolatopsis bartoniae]TVT09916.1 hypothetical protein FNH07_06595 [Amycolatopsis bartoniae]GHF32519.1 hypothetical protein GCM10017566_01350 [Amycolatopsis bartoniae]